MAQSQSTPTQPSKTKPCFCEHCGKYFLTAIRLPGRFCSNPCKYAAKLLHRSPQGAIAYYASYFDRVWANINKAGPVIREDLGPCWPWTGHCDDDGYGRMRLPYRGSSVAAPRIIWLITKGPIPPAMLVCHHCDYPPCCNPDHLWLGTNLENLADMDAKGRRRIVQIGDAHWTRTNPEKRAFGERHGMVKLTETDVRTIFTEWQNGVTVKALSERYNVNHASVSQITHGKTWRHLKLLPELSLESSDLSPHLEPGHIPVDSLHSQRPLFEP